MLEREGKINTPRPDKSSAEDRAVFHGLEEDKAPDDHEDEQSHNAWQRAFFAGADRFGGEERRSGHQLSVDQKDEKSRDDEERGDGGGLRPGGLRFGGSIPPAIGCARAAPC